MSASNVPDAMSAETFIVMKRRNRKGGRNDLVIRRAPAYVIGSHLADDGHVAGSPLASVVPHLAHALISERVARGRNGGGRSYDLSDLATAAYGLEPVIGGADIAYAQVIDGNRADIGADFADAAACCAHRDDIAGWASTANVRAAFDVSRDSSRKLSWPTRDRVPMGRARKSERDAVQSGLRTVDSVQMYGPLVPDHGARYETVRTIRYTPRRATVSFPLPGPFQPRPNQYVTLPLRYASGRIVRYRAPRSMSGDLITTTVFKRTPQPRQADRVFVGHRTITRGAVTHNHTATADRTVAESFNITTADQVEQMLTLIEPGKRATFRTPHYAGTVTRGKSGRYSVRTASGDVLAKGVRTRTTVALAILAPH